MTRVLFKLVCVFGLSVSVFAYEGDGVSQEYISSTTPLPNATNVLSSSFVKIEFDKPILESSITKDTISVVNNGVEIEGKTKLKKNKKSLKFTPKTSLGDGLHEVHVKPITLKLKPSEYKPKGLIQKGFYFTCKLFYKNKMEKCPLIKYVPKKTFYHTTEEFTFKFSTKPSVKSLNLDITDKEIKIQNSSFLTLEALMSDDTKVDINSSIEWIVDKPSLVSIENLNVKALEEGTVTLQAKYENVLSNALTLSFYQEINGHKLPPEPDPTVNNSTILGIDSNDNGVRDDVERWIYKTYSHPIEQSLFMQNAWVYNKVIEDPSRAKETLTYIYDLSACEEYWEYEAKANNESFSLDEYRDIEDEIKEKQFNSIERFMAYKRFNGNLSGGVYSFPNASKEKCLFNEDGFFGGDL